ncbi:MAG: hypothetical protein IT426_18380 [Pirellulales bacterium]|nr:hypothetical protein [Pirellulales bacterium]
MQGFKNQRHPWKSFILGLGAAAALGVTGCQSEFGNQTLPSPYYLENTVQYYPPGPEFKLAREAAAQKAANQEIAQQQQQQR